LTTYGVNDGKRRIALRRWVPYGLFVIGCALSAYAAFYVSSTAEERRRDQFFADAQETRNRLQTRLGTYVEVVRHGTALLAASNETHLGEFRAFVKRLDLPRRYPGIAGIGFAQRVTRRDLPRFVTAIELDGVPPFRLRPEGDRPEYQTVVFLEPGLQHPDVIGLDLAADPLQHEAMARARDTGEPALAARSGAPFDGITRAAVMLYVPVYRNGMAADTVEQRRRALYGFVFSPMRTGRLLGLTAAQPVTFEVYDGEQAIADRLIHVSAPATPAPQYVSAGALSVADQRWLMVVKSIDAVPALMPRPVRNTLAGGLVLSLMLFTIVRIQVGAWEKARRHAAEIRASEQALRSSESRLREALSSEQEARAQAQAADRAKDDFLAAVSHELRTPISAMLGWLSMLNNGALQPDRQAHALGVIERNARLQARLIEDLLDVSRILLGRMSVDRQPVAVAPAVLFVLDSLRPAALAGGVELHAPVLAGPGMIDGDAARVQQVVWNLLSNAIKFTPAGGHVFVELTDDGECVELRVRDTGIGVGAEFLPHLFERFSQASPSTTSSRSGLGLGMAITKHLVEIHGGTVQAHSDGPDTGTTFIVRLPSIAPAMAVAPRDRGCDVGPAVAAGTRQPTGASAAPAAAGEPGVLSAPSAGDANAYGTWTPLAS
jgi:signal transduction histidine kinase